MKIAWPPSLAAKKSWLTRASAGLFVASVLLGVVLAFRTLEAEARGLPGFLEAALWIHALAFLGVSLAARATESSNTDTARAADATLEVVSLGVTAYFFFLFRWGVFFQHEPGAFARSRVAAALSTTHFGVPLVALAVGLAVAALAQVTATTTRRWLTSSAPQDDASLMSALVVGAPRVVLAWTIGFGTLALLGYATGSWSLLPE